MYMQILLDILLHSTQFMLALDVGSWFVFLCGCRLTLNLVLAALLSLINTSYAVSMGPILQVFYTKFVCSVNKLYQLGLC